ncbi:hypothetical protein R1flu_020726 [Riccia fluitans]|uniref:non-specific serine/threonine protein kinase n=1 Tax=Riccia fluitans TaxID=41844 RepID=A0ABD1ZMC0_9MARC
MERRSPSPGVGGKNRFPLARSIFLTPCVTFLVLYSLLVPALSQQAAGEFDFSPNFCFQLPDFISIDCGGEGLKDVATEIEWLPDEKYLDSGEVLKEGFVAVPATVTLDKDTLKTLANADLVQTARVFLPRVNSISLSKYCYVVGVRNTTNYLVRVMFPPRNLTANDPSIDLSRYTSRFYFTVDSTLIATIELAPVLPKTVELVVTPLDKNMYICLVPLEDRSSMPAVSTIELRPLPNELYLEGRREIQTADIINDQGDLVTPRAAGNTGLRTSYLITVSRLNFGGNISLPPIRYPSDQHDRLWYPAGFSDTTQLSAINATRTPIDPKIIVTWDNNWDFPVEVLETAWKGRNPNLNFTVAFNLTGSRSLRPITTFYLGMILVDPDDSGGVQNVYLSAAGGSEIWWADDVAPLAFAVRILQNVKQTFNGDSNFFTFSSLNATVPPKVNAFDLLGEFEANTKRTTPEDGFTITDIAKNLRQRVDILVDTSGDPCLPVPWNWIVCSIESPPRITQINISSMGASGKIPSDFGNLDQLTVLDFSNNTFTGELPESLASITTLRELRLQHNNFTGAVPTEVWTSDSLETVDLSDNQFNTLDLTAWCNGIGDLSAFKRKVNLTNNPIKNVTFPCADHLSNLWIKTYGENPLDLISAAGDSGFILLGKNNAYCENPGNKEFAKRYVCRTSQFENFLNNNSSDNKKVIIISVVCGVLVLLMACILLFGLRRTWKRAKDLHTIQEALARQDVRPPFFKYDQLKTACGDFSEENKLGQGAFGSVYKAVLPDKTVVAVKILEPTDQNITDFLNEMVLITGIKHKHLIQLKGCCVRDRKRILIYEYAENKNLADALWGPERTYRLNWDQRFKICVGVAKGLAYLHEELQPRIIHRDIKAQNILLDKNWEAKVADFGLALPVKDQASTPGSTLVATRIGGTLGYFSPEYATAGKVTEKLDVFSFGILVLEILAGRKCIDLSLTYAPDQIYLKDWGLFDATASGKNTEEIEHALLRASDLTRASSDDPQSIIRMSVTNPR